MSDSRSKKMGCMLTFHVSYILHVRFRSRLSPQSSAFRATVKNHVVFVNATKRHLSGQGQSLWTAWKLLKVSCQNINFTHCCTAVNFFPKRYNVSFLSGRLAISCDILSFTSSEDIKDIFIVFATVIMFRIENLTLKKEFNDSLSLP